MSILRLFISFEIFQLLLKIIICNEANEIDLKQIAEKVNSNLEKYSLSDIKGFHYKKEHLINNSDYSIKLYDIQPLLLIGNDSFIVEEDKKTINYTNLKINYKFNIQIIFNSNSNNKIEIQRKNILAAQTINITFLRNIKDRSRFTLKLEKYDSCENSPIEFLTEIDLFKLQIIKDINFSSDNVKNFLRSTLTDYLKNVIMSYPESTALSNIKTIIEELTNHGTYIISPRNNIKSISFKDIEYELDEDYKFKKIICKVDFSRYKTKVIKDQEIYILDANFNDEGVINFKEENILTDFDDLISNIRFYLIKTIKEVFYKALTSKNN